MTDYRIRLVVDGQDNGATAILSTLGGGLGSIATIAGGILGAQLFQNIASGIMDMATSAISAAGEFQQMGVGLTGLLAREMKNEGAFTSIGAAMDTAAVKAKDYMEVLAKISIMSPYGVQDVQNTFRLAMAYGYTADQATEMTKATLDMAAGVGAGQDQLSRMSYGLTKIREQGAVDAITIRELAKAGLGFEDVLRYVGDQMHINIKDHNDFNAALKSGKITWADFTKYFSQYADENFGGASKRMSTTLMGLATTWDDVFRLTIPKVVGPALDKVTGFLTNVLGSFLDFRDSGVLEAWGQGFEETVGGVVDRVQIVFNRIGTILKDGVFDGNDKGAVDGILYALGLKDLDFSTILKVFDDLKAGFQNLSDFFAVIGSVLGDSIKIIIDAFYKVFNLRTMNLTEILTGLGDGFRAATQWLLDNRGTISAAIVGVADWIAKTLLPAIKAFGDWCAQHSDEIYSVLSGIALYLGAIALQAGVTGVVTAVAEALAALGASAFVASLPILLIAGLIAMLGYAFEQYGTTLLGADAANATFFQKMELGFLKTCMDAQASIFMVGEIIRMTFTILIPMYLQQATGWFQSLWNSVVTGVLTMWLNVIAFITTGFANFMVIWQMGWLTVQVVAQAIWDGIIGLANTFITGVKTVINTGLNLLKTEASTILTGLASFWAGIFDGMKTKIDAVGSALAGVLKAAKDLFDWAMQNVINIVVHFTQIGGLPSVGSFSGSGTVNPNARANGGPVTAGMPYLVGEQGPELFVPKNSGTIIPNGQLGAAGNGARIFQIHIDGAKDPAAVAQEIRRLEFFYA